MEKTVEHRPASNQRGPLRTCERDGFPKVKIGGNWECVAEYLDRCLGHGQVVDLVLRQNTTYIVFEDGHELPVLCADCGAPVSYENLDRARRGIRGRRLESMSWRITTLEDGREFAEFNLEFSKKGLLSRRHRVTSPPEVAARLRHPTHCPWRATSAKGAGKRGRSRGRKR